MQVVVEPVKCISASVAERVQALHMSAYSQEAKLIGAVDFPPLSRTLEDIRSGKERFLGAYVNGELVGVAGTSR